MDREKFSLKKRIKSFGYASNGLKIVSKEEHNFRIHIIASVCVIIAGIFFKISSYEWIMIVFSIGLVFAFELINSSIENLADLVSKEKHPVIKKIKDLSAASVLISAITAFIIGLIIFIPKILSL